MDGVNLDVVINNWHKFKKFEAKLENYGITSNCLLPFRIFDTSISDPNVNIKVFNLLEKLGVFEERANR